jgi:hypothetical protein
MSINYAMLPVHMRDSARLYIERGIPGGSFMTALFSNDLLGAFQRADDTNTAAMRSWASFLYNEAPRGCYGSPEAVKDWIKQGGLSGSECAT